MAFNIANDPNLLGVIKNAVSDGDFMRKLVADPDTTLKNHGVDLGSSSVTFNLDNAGHSLDIKVTNAGANWKGTLNLELVD